MKITFLGTSSRSRALDASGRYGSKIVTATTPASTFYRAVEYHQDYYKKNPVHYKYYRYGSDRDKYLGKIWGKEKS